MEHNNFKDERIEKEINKLSSKFYVFIILVQLLSLVTKLLLELSLDRYIIELFTIGASTIYILACLIRYGFNVFSPKDKDSSIEEIRNQILARASYLIIFTILIGQFGFVLIDRMIMPDVLIYLASWFLPALIQTVYSAKKGLIVWGGDKRKAKTSKNLAKSTFFASISFGTLMYFMIIHEAGNFKPVNILYIAIISLVWGLPYYFAMKGIINMGEKNDNKKLEEVEGEVDQDGK